MLVVVLGRKYNEREMVSLVGRRALTVATDHLLVADHLLKVAAQLRLLLIKDDILLKEMDLLFVLQALGHFSELTLQLLLMGSLVLDTAIHGGGSATLKDRLVDTLELLTGCVGLYVLTVLLQDTSSELDVKGIVNPSPNVLF